MKTRWLATLALLIPFQALQGQNVRRDDVAFQTVTQASAVGTITFTEPIPGATITLGQGNFSCSVANSPSGSSASCSPLAFVCSSASDSICNQPNPTTADSNGNYGFWLKPGRYQAAITGLGVQGRVVTYDLPVGMVDGTPPTESVVIPNLTDIVSASPNPAQTGSIRLANQDFISWRNFANAADFGIIPNGAGTAAAPVDTLVAFGGGGGWKGNYFIDGSASPSQTGAFRMASTSVVGWRNGANTGDVFLSKNTSDNLIWPNSMLLGSLTPGNCVQAGAGGLLTTTALACGSSGGSVTTTGSPASPNVAIFSGATSITQSSGFTQCTGNQFALGILISGAANCNQPAFANLFGNISTLQMNGGTGASSSTFWRGDGTWAVTGVIVNAVNSTGVATNITPTLVVSVSANGFFRASCSIVLTQAASSSSTLPNCVVAWTDGDSSIIETESPAPCLITANTVGNICSGLLGAIWAKSGTSIVYSTTGYASSGGTPMQYAIHLRVEGPF